ncbi:HEAT domain containing protein [Stanieria cyanosphaera PCC 7437]|uniref:HEAT domain containing protein n=1 Tax=Stanieria cyanosphaera (strain ATCC 29371 / PCC 7437) TaxID=111780 RepID=K9XQC8_STAC7|nr:HEAT repeat domain-containing protein [Stanieria cyanosphaera]AFZ33872.1 HEAT domain containing protein [Stanieria cyanosphaera PCC 7437]
MNHQSSTINQVQQLIAAVNQADSADSLLSAVENLVEVRSPEAIPTLVEVLSYNNPGAAVAAVEGLIALGEPVVPYLINNLDEYNYGARAWATRVFAGIGEPSTLDILLKAAVGDFSQSVRRAAARGLGIIRWSKLAPEPRMSAQQEVLSTLLLVVQDGEWVVRYAAVVGLQALAEAVRETQPQLIEKITAKFQELITTEPEPVIRARAQLAQIRISTLASTTHRFPNE